LGIILLILDVAFHVVVAENGKYECSARWRPSSQDSDGFFLRAFRIASLFKSKIFARLDIRTGLEKSFSEQSSTKWTDDSERVARKSPNRLEGHECHARQTECFAFWRQFDGLEDPMFENPILRRCNETSSDRDLLTRGRTCRHPLLCYGPYACALCQSKSGVNEHVAKLPSVRLDCSSQGKICSADQSYAGCLSIPKRTGSDLNWSEVLQQSWWFPNVFMPPTIEPTKHDWVISERKVSLYPGISTRQCGLSATGVDSRLVLQQSSKFVKHSHD
jgi:hypothetical protein